MSSNAIDSLSRRALDNPIKAGNDSSDNKDLLLAVLGTLGKALEALSPQTDKGAAPDKSMNDLLKSLLKLLEELLAKLDEGKGGQKPGPGGSKNPGGPENSGAPGGAGGPGGADDKSKGGGEMGDLLKALMKLLEELIAKLDSKGGDKPANGAGQGNGKGDSADSLKSLLKTLEELLTKLDAKESGKGAKGATGEKGANADLIAELKTKLAELTKQVDQPAAGGTPETKSTDTPEKTNGDSNSADGFKDLLKSLLKLIEELLTKLDKKNDQVKTDDKSGEK